MNLYDIVDHLDDYLHIDDFDDASDNGLQIEGQREVHRVGFAVDACLEAFEQATAAEVDLLIVHHGLFWGDTYMITGLHRRRIKALLQHDMSLYAAHLPLDAHSEVGNNAEVVRLLGLKPVDRFGIVRGQPVALIAAAEPPLSLSDLKKRLSAATGASAHVWPFNQEATHIGVVTGSALGILDEATSIGLDALVCGEIGHVGYHLAKEAGLGVVLGGHYATETLGLKALMRKMRADHDLDCVWIAAPTGL